MARRRHLSRIAVMQSLFEHDSRPEVDVQTSLRFNAEEAEELDRPFAEALLAGIRRHEAEIKQSIQEHAPGWTLERMDPIARCVLLLGTYEILFGNDAPPAVVMNECIDIAKEFGTEESGKFVNGVLNAMVQKR